MSQQEFIARATMATSMSPFFNHFAKLCSSPVQSKTSPVGTEISFKFDYYHPHPPAKVEMQLEINHIYGQ